MQGRFLTRDPFHGLMAQPATFNPYMYALNNPILYTDPTGLWPDWFDYMMGAASQYADDVSFGVFSRIVGDLDYNRCYAFQSGRALGRNIAIVYASVEQVFGAFLLGASLASIGPTSGFSLAAALPSGGGSIAMGGMAIGVEALGAVAGAGIAGHGTLMMAKINNDPVHGGSWKPRITKAKSPFWNSLDHYRSDVRTSGTGKNKRYYQWDYTHGDIEVYDRNFIHIGSADPITGDIYKPGVPGRRLSP